MNPIWYARIARHGSFVRTMSTRQWVLASRFAEIYGLSPPFEAIPPKQRCCATPCRACRPMGRPFRRTA